MPNNTNIDLLLESFRRNGRVNDTLLAALTPADLDLSDGRGGWTVGQHLGHLAHFRPGWLSAISPADAEGIPDVIEGTWQKFDLSERDLSKLAEAFRLGDEAALRAVQSALAEGRTFPDPHSEGTYQSNPAHFLQHIIVHDSHHRGQVLSLLRLGGRTPEQMDALDDHWAIWRE
ncbi:DinB family protein [Deinococcus radiodurans]|uniref:Damage-inducible protein DinB n=1 Tax=Deinococcus radiodurans (strain ATCC 13939 / DSM 20539 / JCM 16871 / CCUG 27074 / LMG 4051 / NBRC 15346 / NCIMB 9279 / VKM B-1422 / R1) TaxID=243230 RepID=Q9RYA0_DEIRA|nr:DinB family protein [Deinococcus radiodurans]AAF09651.1 hypothetical protein DR_0050 [Deinococcus radiodurans R1 = ATCC 13939 = DSM 20539]ANC72636.1 damage-inducible protein DinB [Deinococcus radiodurans R1 = ATCC 13939 = DSM 20539]QEM72835.1 damage-inducible protein DinB [Deinococcus radiodurans]QIP28302.1 damage-inducible protein DinB [Deinococcus radiodurans]UDK99264.1 damage-inducible protein DinB [Deinococcus radiodurans R1 = ATCC 13939 = DSM 20539]